MAITLPKTIVMTAPRPLCLVVVSLGGLAFLLITASLLISSPFGLTIHEYLLGVEHQRIPSLFVSPGENQTRVLFRSQQPSEEQNQSVILGESGSGELLNGLALTPARSFDGAQDMERLISSVPINGNEEMDAGGTFSSVLIDDSRKNNSEIYSDGLASSNLSLPVTPLPSSSSSNSNFEKDELRSCDLYHGKWIYDPAGPLYTNNTCPIIKTWNCQGNGRPDKDYENWRWRPDQCDLPRFDARKFLELMKGKTLAFTGDSLARNQMESMLCILWQVEAPTRKRRNRWYFRSTSTTIFRIWSAWLVRKTTEPILSTPQGLLKLHLDVPDETFMKFLPQFDVVVISSGHWFFKQSAYIRNGNIVGGYLWRPNRPLKKQIDIAMAYGIAIRTALSAIANLANYTGLTVVRTYSPDHYAGGKWKDGEWCGRIDSPESKLVWNGRTEVMHRKQIRSYERAVKKVKNGSRMRLMDITLASGYRHDGHPGPYYRGSNGKPLSKDCGHWCLPGPIDTWNEILFEIIKRVL